MSKASKIYCPKCHSNNLYKFGKDKQGNQKYQCKECRRQLAPTPILPSSNTKIYVKLNFKGMRFPIHIILMALDLYFLNESSTRRISQYLFRLFNVKVSHVTIANWIKKFDAYFKLKSDRFLKDVDLSDSDEWHADETVVFINGKHHYLWLVIASESRLIFSTSTLLTT